MSCLRRVECNDVPSKRVDKIASMFSGSIVAKPVPPSMVSSTVGPSWSKYSVKRESSFFWRPALKPRLTISRARGHLYERTKVGGLQPLRLPNSTSAWNRRVRALSKGRHSSCLYNHTRYLTALRTYLLTPNRQKAKRTKRRRDMELGGLYVYKACSSAALKDMTVSLATTR